MKTGVEPQRSREVKPSSNLARTKQTYWSGIGVTWRCERGLGVTCAVLSSECRLAREFYTLLMPRLQPVEILLCSLKGGCMEHQEIPGVLHCKPWPSSLLQKKGAIQILRVIYS